MPAKGHKADCQCPVCKKVRAKDGQVQKFQAGQSVILLDPPMPGVPKGEVARIKSIDGDIAFIHYHQGYYHVKLSDLK